MNLRKSTTSSNVIDLRSDTVTKPSEAMRRAMYEAEVADDTYDGDPTVKRLQELAAEKTGKEAALFVVSGTMGNLLGVLVNTKPRQEVILGDASHQFLWEVGGIARIGNCITHTIPFRRGFLDPADIEDAIRADAREATTTGLIRFFDRSRQTFISSLYGVSLGKPNIKATLVNVPSEPENSLVQSVSL